MLLPYILKVVEIDERGQVVYFDGEIGSSLIDHLKYWTTSNVMKVLRPPDADKMEELLKGEKVPFAAVGSGKLSTFRHSPINNWKTID